MRFLLGLTRTLVALSYSLWIGGLAFFGVITAAIMFRMTREAGVADMAPRMVGPMLSRFAIICTVCSVIIVVGWLIDGFLTTRALWWRLQGGLTCAAVLLGLYINFGFLPTLVREQTAVLPFYSRSLFHPETLSPTERQIRADFDAKHERSTQLFQVDLWLLVAALGCLMARSLPTEVGPTRRNEGQVQPV